MQARESEDGHDRVADELLDAASVALENRLHLAEIGVEDFPKRFGVQRLA